MLFDLDMQRLLPPQVFVLCGLASTAIGLLVPVAGPLGLVVRLVGIPFLVAGIALAKRSAALFEQSDTNIKTFDEPDVLVRTGPFRFSRNPMYLGFTLALGGVALLVGSLSAVIGPVFFWLLADRWYVPFEERRMMARFGPAYQQYRSIVPRWVGRQRPVQSSVS